MNSFAIAAWIAGLLGFGLLITGVALIHAPTAFITAGLSLIGWAWLADKASARALRAAKPEGG